MKKLAILILSITTLTFGCKKEPAPVSKVVNVTYPTITLIGQQYIHIAVNETYVDQGAILTDDISGAQTTISPKTNEINASTPGLYRVIYEAANANGFKTTAIRTVLVLDYTPPAGLDSNFNISGQYERTATGAVINVIKMDNGLYIIDRVGGSSEVPVYMITPDTTSIDVPAQISYNVSPPDVDCINETFHSGPPYSFSYNVIANNFGAGTRTFVHL